MTSRSNGSDKRWTGIARHGAGWRATVSCGRGRQRIRKTFPAGTSPAEMQRWRADTQASLRLTRKPRASHGTFEHDAKRYLEAVSAMPSLVDRTRDIQVWVDVFRTRHRDTITPVEIRAQRDSWLKAPRSSSDRRPVSPHTVNLRLRALSNLYRVLDGPQAHNPVRDVPEAPEPRHPPRLLDYATVRAILDAMPESVTKMRVRVLAYTGLPPKQLMQVTADDVDFTAGTVRVAARMKGHGAKAVTLPLVPLAREAFQDLARVNGWGPFNIRAIRNSFVRAASKLGLKGVRPYDLRHAFALAVYDLTGDDHLVMALLQHADLKTSHHYRQAILEKVWQRKAEALGQHFGITPLPESIQMRGKRLKRGQHSKPLPPDIM